MPSVWQNFITDTSGEIVAGATITVYRESDAGLATIYADPAGSAKSNPFTADASGFAEFFADGGDTYRIEAASGGFTANYRYVPLGDARGFDVGTASGQLVEKDDLDQLYAPQVQNNYTAVTAPTVNDDETEGYSPSSKWSDNSQSPPELYQCVDATAGAAVWVKTSLSLDELGTMATEDAGALDSQYQNNGANRAEFLNKDLETVEIAGTAYTVTATDNGKLIKTTSASDVTITLPEDATEALNAGFQFGIEKGGAGNITIAVQGSDVFNSADGIDSISTLYAAGSIIKEQSGVWFGVLGVDQADTQPIGLANQTVDNENRVLLLDDTDDSGNTLDIGAQNSTGTVYSRVRYSFNALEIAVFDESGSPATKVGFDLDSSGNLIFSNSISNSGITYSGVTTWTGDTLITQDRADSRLGGSNVGANMVGPGAGVNGYLISWNNGDSNYVLVNSISWGAGSAITADTVSGLTSVSAPAVSGTTSVSSPSHVITNGGANTVTHTAGTVTASYTVNEPAALPSANSARTINNAGQESFVDLNELPGALVFESNAVGGSAVVLSTVGPEPAHDIEQNVVFQNNNFLDVVGGDIEVQQDCDLTLCFYSSWQQTVGTQEAAIAIALRINNVVVDLSENINFTMGSTPGEAWVSNGRSKRVSLTAGDVIEVVSYLIEVGGTLTVTSIPEHTTFEAYIARV